MVVLWDSLGTLLDVDPVRDRYPGWLERVLHHGAALTLVGEFAPFAELAEAANPDAFRMLGEELRPHSDVADALDVLEESGIRSWIVTNGGRDSTEHALGEPRVPLRRHRLDRRRPALEAGEGALPRDAAPRRCCAGAGVSCAAHAWDVRAAVRYGLRAVWVDRLEVDWPLPGDPHEPSASSLTEAARLASRA